MSTSQAALLAITTFARNNLPPAFGRWSLRQCGCDAQLKVGVRSLGSEAVRSPAASIARVSNRIVRRFRETMQSGRVAPEKQSVIHSRAPPDGRQGSHWNQVHSVALVRRMKLGKTAVKRCQTSALSQCD